jgi:hypothetical protein
LTPLGSASRTSVKTAKVQARSNSLTFDSPRLLWKNRAATIAAAARSQMPCGRRQRKGRDCTTQVAQDFSIVRRWKAETLVSLSTTLRSMGYRHPNSQQQHYSYFCLRTDSRIRKGHTGGLADGCTIIVKGTLGQWGLNWAQKDWSDSIWACLRGTPRVTWLEQYLHCCSPCWMRTCCGVVAIDAAASGCCHKKCMFPPQPWFAYTKQCHPA